ncbi:histidine kinase [Streptomyces dangxiongensis]|uniref:histidine kinase n=1 Tax=Streptomyces dangxiongensis TaxID=1442032 RepID=A0A3G2J6X6_9ACTN|nr:ATP-binding protein [Streptomyces dangxiongensis]AYN37970.1 histidine kinase [Streptomyces dangxiongensis]
MTAPSHPGERPSLRTFVSALALTGVLSALVVCTAVAVAPGSVRTPLAWGAGTAAVLLSAAVATAAHALRTARNARRRLENATQDIGRLLQQQARTTEEARQEQQRLIDELGRQRTEFTESFAAERARREEEAARELDRLGQDNARLSKELDRARRERAAAVSATSNAAARMQALATATLADLRAMEERHTGEDVLADLLQLDHRTAQAGRLADSIAVLTGARSGRRWARPIGMESILRGAMGRIAGYRRVRVHSTSEAAVAGHAAEGVMHALAELLDNAANFSPPNAEVHVYVEEVPAGAIVSVEDSGLVMGEVQLRRAERAVSGDVSELGGLTGTRLGLAVVGRLARKHGLKVSFRPSARGGTGVLLLIPQDILTGPAPAGPATPAAPAAPTPRPQNGPPVRAQAPAAVDASPVHEPAVPPQEGPAGLPRRRRGRTLAEAERARSAHGAAGARSAPGAEEGRTRAARFSSFRQAVRPSAPGTHRPGPAPAAPAPTPADRAPARDGGTEDPPQDHHTPTPAPDDHTTAPAGHVPSQAQGHHTAAPAPADPAALPVQDHHASGSAQGTAGPGSPTTSSHQHQHQHPEGDSTS